MTVQLKGENMKKLILTLFLFFTSTSAIAKWIEVGQATNEKSVAYVDYTTIHKKGSKVTMWSMLDYKTIQSGTTGNFLSEISLEEYDCINAQSRTLSIADYSENMQEGTVAYTNTFNPPDIWRPVIPNTISEALWKSACGKK